MKKKNGFTLIELLAVIVILAIIALIAVPQVLKILDKARLNAAKDSTYGIVKAAETYATNFMLENNGTLPSEAIEFECDNTGCNLKTTLTGYNLTGLNNLDFKGTKPTSGTIKISNNGRTIVAENLQINGFSCSYSNDTATCTKEGSSETPEPTTPVVTGPTSENPPSGVEGYTGVLKIVYLNPANLNEQCDSSNINSDTETKTGCMKWYAYADDGTNYTMILDHNTTDLVAWISKEDYIAAGGTEEDYGTDGKNDKGSITVNARLDYDTTDWNNSLSPRLISAEEIATITENTSWTPSERGFYFETGTATTPNPYPTPSKYGWLFDRTISSCTTYGCLNNATGTHSGYGYWTSSPHGSTTINGMRVRGNGYLFGHTVSSTTDSGVRPVITVEKSLIS